MYAFPEILVLLITHHVVVGYKYSFGDCPKIKSVEKFNMTRFSGHWYGIEANDNTLSCTKFSFAVTENNVKFTIDESTNLRYLNFVQYFFSRSGTIKITFEEDVAIMKIKWHWTFAPEEMIVFETNYDDYAGVLFCAKNSIASETRIFILSRQQNLTREHINKVKTSLRLNSYSTKEMAKIEQIDCTTKNSDNTLKIIIEEDALSPKSIVRKVDKILKDNFGKRDCSEEQSTGTEATTNQKNIL